MMNKKPSIFAHLKGKRIKPKQCARTILPLRGVSLDIMKQSKYFSEMQQSRETSFKFIYVFRHTPLKGGIGAVPAFNAIAFCGGIA